MLAAGVAFKTILRVDSNFLAACASWTKNKPERFFFVGFLLVYNEPVRLVGEHILTSVIKLFDTVHWI
jgi:small-conductance mechanosensitive channel